MSRVHSGVKNASIPTCDDRAAVLANTIRQHLLGVRPDDQAVVLEDDDWRLILANLERPFAAPDRPRR